MTACFHGALKRGLMAAATALAVSLLVTGCDRGDIYDLAITEARVVSLTHDTVLADRNIFIRNGRIARVEGPGAAPPPEATRTVEAGGAYVLPGLHDMHVHLPTGAIVEALDLEPPPGGLQHRLNLVPYLVNGITTVRVMSGAPDLLQLRDSVASGTVLGPRMIVGSPMIAGDPPILPEPITRVIETEQEATRAAEEYGEAGYDFLKIRSNVSRSVFDALRRVAKRLELPIVGHVPEGDSLGLEYVLGSGPLGVAHLEEFPSGGRGLGAEELESYVQIAAENDVAVATTLVVHADLLDQIEDPSGALTDAGSTYVPEHLRSSFWRTSVLNQPTTTERAASLRRQLGFLQNLARRLYEAGVPTMVGTDALVPTVAPGFSVHRELKLLAKSGLDEADVLRMATVVPARQLSGSPSAGTITVGERADLLLLARNPLEELDALRAIEGIVLGGRFIGADELADQLDKVEDAYRGQRPSHFPDGH